MAAGIITVVANHAPGFRQRFGGLLLAGLRIGAYPIGAYLIKVYGVAGPVAR